METQPPKDFDEGMLDVGDGHTIYWRAQGPRDAPVMLVVHGGPGGAMNVKWAEVLEQDKWRIVFFDQRSCGKSTPFGLLAHNGIDALVGDMEKLRIALKIEQWALFGGSWGTTLGLAYGVAHPEVSRIRSAVSDSCCAACFSRGARTSTGSCGTCAAYSQKRTVRFSMRSRWPPASVRRARTTSCSSPRRRARAWTQYETTLSVVNKPEKEPDEEEKRPSAEANAAAISMALLERHYMANELPPMPLLPLVTRIAHLPCRIVHGRFDMVCPADQALALAARWPSAELAVVDAAGHWTGPSSRAISRHCALARQRSPTPSRKPGMRLSETA